MIVMLWATNIKYSARTLLCRMPRLSWINTNRNRRVARHHNFQLSESSLSRSVTTPKCQASRLLQNSTQPQTAEKHVIFSLKPTAGHPVSHEYWKTKTGGRTPKCRAFRLQKPFTTTICWKFDLRKALPKHDARSWRKYECQTRKLLDTSRWLCLPRWWAAARVFEALCVNPEECFYRFQFAISIDRAQKTGTKTQRTKNVRGSILFSEKRPGRGRNLDRGERDIKKKCVSHCKTDETGISQWKKPWMNEIVQCIITIIIAAIYMGTCQNWSRPRMKMMKKIVELGFFLGWSGSLLKTTVQQGWIESI